MHCKNYLRETAELALSIDDILLEAMVLELTRVRKDLGRVFVIGLGGSAANAMHMASDLRKLCDIDARDLSNIAELTARSNDEGPDSIFTGWMKNLSTRDCLFVLSVGGGTDRVSKAITDAVKMAKDKGASILGVVGPGGGMTASLGNCVLKLQAPPGRVTPHTEAFQAVAWHCLVSHPLLQVKRTTW